MPSSDIEWVMFLYFALGALGGIVFLGSIFVDVINALRVAWRKQ